MNNYNKTIIDVRSPEEFKNENVAGSINIPLNEIQQRIDEIKKMPYPIVLCCANGHRSGQAAAYLNMIGIECENGGRWVSLNNN